MRTPLSTRIAWYYGALFLASIGTLFSLWYLGFPPGGLIGARDQRLTEATRILELQADHQVTLIANAIKERRGDVLSLAESNRLAGSDADRPAPQATVEQLFDRLQRAYPDRYQHMMVVDPASARIIGSSTPDEAGGMFHDADLIRRASHPGVTEIIEEGIDSEGMPKLSIIRQIRRLDDKGHPEGRLLHLLVVDLDLRHLVSESLQEEAVSASTRETTLLYNQSGQILSRHPASYTDQPVLRPAEALIHGFEGTLQAADSTGQTMIVVYRHLQLSGMDGWIILHYASRDEVLSALRGNARALIVAGLALTLLALVAAHWTALRLARPLRRLTESARRFGAGDLSARVEDKAASTQEVSALTLAFNSMAESIEKAHHTLELRVSERTAELARERDTVQRYLDIVGVMLMVLDREGRIMMINRRGSQILGAPERELIGTDWFSRFPPVAQREFRRQRYLARMNGNSPAIPTPYENTVINTLGQERVLWWTNTPLFDEHGAPAGMLCSAEDVTERRQAEDEVRQLAYFDPLTGLANRRLLYDRLRGALAASARHGRQGALLYIDLDNFKTLNDTLGHNIGDLLLRQIAIRLTECVRAEDTLARIGGDEFVVMLEDLDSSPRLAAKQAEAVGQKIVSLFERRFNLAGFDHFCTASVGITLFADGNDNIEDLFKHADLSMYEAKSAGRNTLRFFDHAMQAAVTQRIALEGDLSEALLRNQFVLYYQPQVGEGNRPTGAEALVRWQHPQRGLVSPGEFIQLAEETGLIRPLGNWVLEHACTQIAAWARDPLLEPLTLAVNVSALQFHSHDFVDKVLAIVARTGANPRRLKLELTESVLVANVEDIIARMTRLKQEGIGFSLDDFGTGYSSLSYLKRLPLDQLKIAQEFIRDILDDANDAAIAHMVVALGESLGLSVIAEGVETATQRNLLAGIGCHAYQGYLFSRPLPLAAYEAWIRQCDDGSSPAA